MQTPPGSEPGESARPSLGPQMKTVTKKRKQSLCITQRRGVAASPGFCFHLYKKHPFFSGQEYRSSQRSRESSTTSGAGLLRAAAAAAASLSGSWHRACFLGTHAPGTTPCGCVEPGTDLSAAH